MTVPVNTVAARVGLVLCLIGAAHSQCPANEVPVDGACRGFALAVAAERVASGPQFIDPAAVSTVAVGDVFKIAPLAIDVAATTVSSGTVADLRFSLDGAPAGFFMNGATGIVLAQFEPEDAGATFTIEIRVTDASGLSATLEVIELTAQYRDTEVPENGPGGQGCAHGTVVDAVPFDLAFGCDCTGTLFTGDNCEIRVTAELPQAVPGSGDGDAGVCGTDTVLKDGYCVLDCPSTGSGGGGRRRGQATCDDCGIGEKLKDTIAAIDKARLKEQTVEAGATTKEVFDAIVAAAGNQLAGLTEGDVAAFDTDRDGKFSAVEIAAAAKAFGVDSAVGTSTSDGTGSSATDVHGNALITVALATVAVIATAF